MEEKNTKSYDITNLFLVAFFGGVIPTLILGVRNAKWLGISKKTINIFITIGICILFSKVTMAILVKKIIFLKQYSGFLKLIYTGSTVLLYLFYYKSVETKYKLHMELVGTKQPLLRDALVWSIIGFLIELAIFLAAAAIVSIR